MIPALLNSEISLPGHDLPERMVEEIIEQLTLYVEDTDEVFELWRAEDDMLVIPRGFAFTLADLSEKFEVEFDWEDDRKLPKKRGEVWGEALPLEPEQARLVEEVLEVDQGIIKAPTGAGKTVTMLELVRLTKGKSIVVVNTKEIASQWIKRAKQYLGEGFPVTLVGDGKFAIAEDGLTVAIQGTLWSRREKLDKEGFFDLFVTAMLDECHHATARTYNDVFARFSAKTRIGASATPEKTGIFELAEAVIGPVVAEIDEDNVDRIEKPTIEVIETKLGWAEPSKKKSKQKPSWAVRQEYEKALKALIASEDRRQLVVNEIMQNQIGHRNLIIAKRIELLELLYDELEEAGYPEDQLIAMVGAHALGEREEAIEKVDEGPCVMLTTLADEALDVPLLEVMHLVWPTANAELLLQQIGRIRRKHPDKLKSMVIDYRDKQVRSFEKQYMTRRHGVYDPKGFPVIKRPKDDPHAL